MNVVQNIQPDEEIAHFDVLIGGAGISGIGIARHLQLQCQGKSFTIIEAKDTHGGTWETHKYPGIRSDSDLYTFGYRFKPWSGNPIAEADLILNYMAEVIEEYDLDQHIQYGTKILSASWSTPAQKWFVRLQDVATGAERTVSATFFWSGLGYYDHENPYTPDWDGFADYKGEVIHPQTWPEGYDYSGKKIIVIGSGATAATLIPNMAGDAGHITMLQRSPTYFFPGQNRNGVADFLRKMKLPESWVHYLTRQFILGLSWYVQSAAQKNPEKVKARLRGFLKQHHLDDETIDAHFTPSYRPWQQRLAFIPDGDMFAAMRSGKVDVVTDHIERFTETGIQLKSGTHLEADLIVTATGFKMVQFGKVQLDVDGEVVDPDKLVTHRGVMFSGLPNFSSMFGYIRTSWTMRVDLVCDYVCRLINHMDKKGYQVVTPTLPEGVTREEFKPWFKEEEFNPGYIKRAEAAKRVPHQLGEGAWAFDINYYSERKSLPKAKLDDPSLVYEKVSAEADAKPELALAS